MDKGEFLMHGNVVFMLGAGLLLMVLQMGILWAVHLPLRSAAVVDVGWGAGLGLLAILYAFLGVAPTPRWLLLVLLVGSWAFRLSWHLYRDRVAGGQPEEGRYITLRNSWGSKASLYFLFFFEAQGILNVVLSLPFLLIALNVKSSLSPLELVGAGLWLFALNGEALADRQLKAFKANPANKGKVCNAGFWKYSRHPNYFCEWLIWCAYALVAAAAPWGWLGWISPAIILFLLLRVSGIPPTEKQALKSRGEAYRRYQAATSVFFPWFPKTNATIGNGR